MDGCESTVSVEKGIDPLARKNLKKSVRKATVSLEIFLSEKVSPNSPKLTFSISPAIENWLIKDSADLVLRYLLKLVSSGIKPRMLYSKLQNVHSISQYTCHHDHSRMIM